MCARSKCEEVRDAADARRRAQQSLRRAKRHAQQQQEEEEPPELKLDMIGVTTARYHTFTLLMASLVADLQRTKLYTVMARTTQPAHVVTLVAVVTVSMCLLPQGAENTKGSGSSLMYFIYLVAFTTHFGAQIWMTFVSGLTLFFALPRHTFGAVQQVLFPKYFTLNTFLSLVTLIVFIKIHPAPLRDAHVMTQVYAMIFCFLLELTIRLCITPPLLQLMAAKNAMEKAYGIGLEVGRHNIGPLAMCPHYMKLHKAFRTMHMTVAIGNMLTMACTTIHLYYLSSKICLT